jgi:aminoglycoside 3-N-acetyltransferase
MLDIDLKNIKPPYLIHSDAFKTFVFIKEAHKSIKAGQDALSLHFNFLCKLFDKSNIILPSFNYDFSKTKIYNVKSTSSQVGSLTNFVLKNNLLQRTKTPIFSFLTNIPDLLIEHNFPFSSGSVFDFIHRNDGSIVFYGTEISSCTFLHFVENQYGPPKYRYDKKLIGTITNDHSTNPTFVEFHVRPFGIKLDYNWNFLFKLLSDKRVIHRLSNNFFVIKARDLSNIWGSYFVKNQFDILSIDTKEIIFKKFISVGRRFIQKDFETVL